MCVCVCVCLQQILGKPKPLEPLMISKLDLILTKSKKKIIKKKKKNETPTSLAAPFDVEKYPNKR